jgi:hypothetical protein
MNAKIEDMVAKMERSRSTLNDALGKLAPQAEIYPTWKVKQLMDHIAGWDELVYVTLCAYLKGDSPTVLVSDGIDHFNAESISARKDIPIEQSRQKYDITRTQVIQVLRQLPPEMLTQKYLAPWGGKCNLSSIVRIFVSHEQEHAKHIEEVLKSSSTSG